MRECQLQIEQKISDMKIKTTNYPNEKTSESPIDCPKENYNVSLINSVDNCLHPRVFKHTTCVVNDASIGVEF